MAAQFIGLTVSLALKSSPNARIQGLVSKVADQELTLHNGETENSTCRKLVGMLTVNDAVVFANGTIRLPDYTVHGEQIADLEILPVHSNPVNSGKRPGHSSSNGNHSVHLQTHVSKSAHDNDGAPQDEKPGYALPSQTLPFIDPAIVSVNQKPSQQTNGRNTCPSPDPASQHVRQKRMVIVTSQLAETPVQTQDNGPAKSVRGKLAPFAHLDEEADASTSDAGLLSTDPRNVNARSDAAGRSIDVAAMDNSLKEISAKLQTAGDQGQAFLHVQHDGAPGRRRRGPRGNGRKLVAEGTPPVRNVVPNGADSSGKVNSVAASPLPVQKVAFGGDMTPSKDSAGVVGPDETRLVVLTSRRRRRRRRAQPTDENDGWATEEATDIQGMGEFDFQGNLSKFDKRTIFDQMRAEDSTANESLLVTLNRRPAKPGTAGGKNLHHTENVLDDPKGSGRWNSEAGETEEDVSGEGIRSGRSSRRAMSRQSFKQLPSRKGSAGLATSGQLRSCSSTRVLSPLNRGQPFAGAAASSAREKPSPVGSPMRSKVPSKMGSLRLLPSGRLCPAARPMQMLDIERIAEVEIGLTEDMITENAGRGIAEIALLALSGGSRRSMKKQEHSSLPVAVVLAGNHQSGLRAVAGARHLRNRGVRVLLCVLGFEHQALLLESLRRQLQIFQNSGGILGNWEDLAVQLASLNGTPDLVIDGLLGTHVSYGDLRRDDQVVAHDLTKWVNNSKVDVLSVDVPSGIDTFTGWCGLR